MSQNKTEIAVSGETGFAIIDEAQSRELLYGAFEQMGISGFQLDKLSIPGGGSTAFMVQTLEGEVPMQEVEAIIVDVKPNQKVWWKETIDKASEGAQPDCKSMDGKTGFGINSLEESAEEGAHDCLKCHWNQFGSTRSGGTGKGKDCKDSTHLFFFQPGNALPTFLSVPPTSIPVFNAYYMALLNSRKHLHQVVTKIGLDSVRGGGGGSYSKLTMSFGRDLDEASAKGATELREKMRGYLGSFDAFNDSSE